MTTARIDLAALLSDALRYALHAGLIDEAAVIAKLIEATINNTTTTLALKLN